MDLLHRLPQIIVISACITSIHSGCKDGYMGLTCADPCRANCATCTIEGVCLSCVSGKFGIQCENDCPEFCGGDRICNKNTGNCFECFSGRFGPNCTEFCSTNCLQPGACLRNGDCTNGCVAGWIGPRCDMQCSVQNCEKCIDSSGQISCEICNDGYFLDNTGGCQKCPSTCVSCEHDLRCNQCIPGFKGSLCNEECNTNCIDGLCSIDGSCTFGCNNAKYGIGCGIECEDNCDHCFSKYNCTKCLPGFWGLYCQRTCGNNCYNCTRSYLICESCKPGFYGTYCSNGCLKECETCESPDRCSSCRKGWSGPLCQCSENCSQEACGNDGKCLSGCKDSFYGDFCNVTCPSGECQKCDQFSGYCTLCLKGFFGSNCKQQCSTTCVETACDITGECLQGCEENFGGVMCAEKREDSLPEDVHADITVPLAVAFALACLVSLGLLGTTIYFRRQRNEERLRRLEEKNYVSANFIATEQEPHQYSSLQDFSGPLRPLSSE